MRGEEITAAEDRDTIIAAADIDIYRKYNAGQEEHKTKLWTGGAQFFATAARQEATDLICYTHHLSIRLGEIEQLAKAGMADPDSASLYCKQIMDKIVSQPQKY